MSTDSTASDPAAPPPLPSRTPPKGRWAMGFALLAAIAGLGSAARPDADFADADHGSRRRADRDRDRDRDEDRAPALAAPADPSLDRRYALRAGGKMELSVEAADVRVVPAPGRDLRVTVRLAAGRSSLPKGYAWHESVSPDHVVVELEREGHDGSWIFGSHSHRDGIEEVVVELPADASLSVETGLGDITVEAAAASVELATGAGDVSVSGAVAELSVETGAGDVDVSNAAGDVDVETGAGDVHLEGVRADVRVATGAGEVAVAGSPTSLEIESGAGDVELELTGLTGHAEVESGIGSIEVRAAAGVGFRLDAESGLGSIDVHARNGQQSASNIGAELTATVGAGGPLVSLESGAGSIEVRTPEAASAGIRVE